MRTLLLAYVTPLANDDVAWDFYSLFLFHREYRAYFVTTNLLTYK